MKPDDKKYLDVIIYQLNASRFSSTNYLHRENAIDKKLSAKSFEVKNKNFLQNQKLYYFQFDEQRAVFSENILKQYELFLGNELNYYLYDFGIYHTQIKVS